MPLTHPLLSGSITAEFESVLAGEALEAATTKKPAKEKAPSTETDVCCKRTEPPPGSTTTPTICCKNTVPPKKKPAKKKAAYGIGPVEQGWSAPPPPMA
jgi:hypothetical protein